MLKDEASWIRTRLGTLGAEDFPLLNVGSSSAEFRERVQPWIDESIFAPLRKRGATIIHQDLFPARGVDIAGDLLSTQAQQAIAERGVRSILCSNVLEHVIDRRVFASSLVSMLPAGGRLLVTVPRAFPYHADPIDTMFRPSVAELGALFPELSVISGETVACGGLLGLVLQNPRRLVERLMSPPPAPTGSVSRRADVATWLPWLVRPFEVTCVELAKAPTVAKR